MDRFASKGLDMDKKVKPESTKAVKQRREQLIKTFFSQIREDGSWKNYITGDGGLRLTEVRKRLGICEGGDSAPAWNEDYFKGKHATVIYRRKFELWVKEMLSRRDDHDFLGDRFKEQDFGLPLWLEDEVLSDAVRNLIVDQAKSLTLGLEKIKKLQSQLDGKDKKNLELQSEKANLIANFYVRDDDFSLGIRTLRYD